MRQSPVDGGLVASDDPRGRFAQAIGGHFAQWIEASAAAPVRAQLVL